MRRTFLNSPLLSPCLPAGTCPRTGVWTFSRARTVRNANGVLKQSPRLAHSAYLGSRVRTRCGGNATPLPTRRHSVVAGRIFRLPPSGGWKAARTRTLESVRDVVVQPFQAAGWRSFPAPQRTAGCSGPWWWFQDAPIVAALVILSFILRTAQYRHDETAVNIAPLQSTTNRSAEPLFGTVFRVRRASTRSNGSAALLSRVSWSQCVRNNRRGGFP